MTFSLGLINYGLLLIFGVVLSVYFAGVERTPKNYFAVLSFVVITSIIQLICWHLWGFDITAKLYPFIAHLPLTAFIALYFKRPWLLSFISVITAYLCCQTPHWFGTMTLYLFDSKTAYYLTNILAILPVFYLLKNYIAPPIYNLMVYSRKFALLFGAVPFMYYIFDYVTTVYTNLLYSGIEVFAEFMPSLIPMIYFIFVLVYHNELQKRDKSERENILLSMQNIQSQRELSSLQKMQEQTIYYRHDLRHHFSLIKGYLDAGEIDKIREYLAQAVEDIDAITPKYFCKNDTVNLILSAFDAKAKQNGVTLLSDIDLPQNINLKDTELCTIISNGLQNAIKAASLVSNKNLMKVQISCKIHKDKLLIFIENPYLDEIIMENGLPKSNDKGHGFGSKSMDAIAKKHNGFCSFEANNGIFTLRLVLPLI